MTLKPLEQWICDECDDVIREIDHGWVEWLQRYGEQWGFRIVHHKPWSPRGNCQMPNQLYEEGAIVADLPLREFSGDSAIPVLLALVDVGPYFEPRFQGPRVRDVREWVELTRRLMVPYYEEARFHFSEAEESNLIAGANEVSLFLPATLRGIVDRFGNHH